MRGPAVAVAVAMAFLLHGQSTWLPLSREVERPFAGTMQRVGSNAHTAVRPYRLSDVRALEVNDSANTFSLLPALDRWAGVRNGRSFRWGPLLDAQVLYDIDSAKSGVGHRAGAGFWLEKDFLDKLSFHVDAQAWSERFPTYLDTLVRATQVTPGEGYGFGEAPAYTHYDWNGYMSWDPGKAFNLTVGRGKNSFGEGYRSMFLSDEAYSYPYLKVTTTVWKIKYVNLFSMMNDIRGADGDVADFNRKYTSMHYLSWNAGKRLNVALFESIVWSQGDSLYPRGFDVNYLNPVIFYRPVEFAVGSPDNALLGGGLNVKVGKQSLIYSQVLLDEFLMREVRAGNGWYANKQALQIGVVSRNAFKVTGLLLRAEWNYVRPFMYTHSDTRQNYSHSGQPLAHPYGSNFQELLLYGELVDARWRHSLRASMAWLGRDSTYSNGNNIFRPESDRFIDADGDPQNYGYHVGSPKGGTLLHVEMRSGFLVDPSTGTRIEASYMLRMRTPDSGDVAMANVFRLGLVCYFRERHPEQEVRYVLD